MSFLFLSLLSSPSRDPRCLHQRHHPFSSYMSTSFSLDTVMIVIRTATATANGDLGNLAIVSTACRRLRLIAAIGLFAYFPPSTLLTSILSCSPLMMLILLPAHGIFPCYSYSYIATYYSYTLARGMLYLLFNPSTLLFVPLGYPMTYRHSFLPHVYPRSRSLSFPVLSAFLIITFWSGHLCTSRTLSFIFSYFHCIWPSTVVKYNTMLGCSITTTYRYWYLDTTMSRYY